MNELIWITLRNLSQSISKCFHHIQRDSDTIDQSQWWRCKSSCTRTTCPTDQSQKTWEHTFETLRNGVVLGHARTGVEQTKKDAFSKIKTIIIFCRKKSDWISQCKILTKCQCILIYTLLDFFMSISNAGKMQEQQWSFQCPFRDTYSNLRQCGLTAQNFRPKVQKLPREKQENLRLNPKYLQK